ncbi:phage portal protein [Algoriphagus sp. H41]|uniref:Phage portal protein n=1 Tax=Algoriphagus oliviformis TaxID=2811231 RepID=A0ABS3C6H5_9BACT|nr:phage portal protein [Algoriphagus oliviformis]MBN7811756.1 phage portal protein [Algoriphagus oliviformis]
MIDFKRIDHVLICIPLGARDDARSFYGETLKLREIPGDHPNGALWFAMGDAELHVREEDLSPVQSGRHPAFEVGDLEGAKEFLKTQGIDVAFSSLIEGRDRCFFRDPWGNRFELIEFGLK